MLNDFVSTVWPLMFLILIEGYEINKKYMIFHINENEIPYIPKYNRKTYSDSIKNINNINNIKPDIHYNIPFTPKHLRSYSKLS